MLKSVANLIRLIYSRVIDFFFIEESAEKIALFRIFFGTVLLLGELLMISHVTEYFSDAGFYTGSQIAASSQPFTFSLLFWIHSPLAVQLLYWILVLATLCFTLGIFPRLMNLITLALLVSFQQRNPYLYHAGDMISRIVLFYTLFLDTGRAYTFFPRQGATGAKIEGWPVRLIQIQICFVYIFSAISKLSNGQQWIRGEFLYSMLNFPGRSYFDFGWLIHVPWLVAIMTYGVIAVELSFIYFVWQKPTRLLGVALVFLMHVGIDFSINVIYFSETMYAILFLFLTHDEIMTIGRWLRATYLTARQRLFKTTPA